jgi:hypothetical protein
MRLEAQVRSDSKTSLASCGRSIRRLGTWSRPEPDKPPFKAARRFVGTGKAVEPHPLVCGRAARGRTVHGVFAGRGKINGIAADPCGGRRQSQLGAVDHGDAFGALLPVAGRLGWVCRPEFDAYPREVVESAAAERDPASTRSNSSGPGRPNAKAMSAL